MQANKTRLIAPLLTTLGTHAVEENTIFASELTLKGKSLKGTQSKTLYVDVLKLGSSVTLHSDLTIYARKIIVPSKGCKFIAHGVDTKGWVGASTTEIRRGWVDPASHGKDYSRGSPKRSDVTTHQLRAAHGHEGKPGNMGSHGNSITIYADTIQGGSITFDVRGGAGAKGQTGGNGASMKHPPAEPSEVSEKIKNDRSYEYKKNSQGNYDYRRTAAGFRILYELVGFYLYDYLSVYIGRKGDNGFDGGNPGAGGKSGAGGDGGNVKIELKNLNSKPAIKVNQGGGRGGPASANGKIGKGGPGARGRRHWYQTRNFGNQLGGRDYSGYSDRQGAANYPTLDVDDTMMRDLPYYQELGGRKEGNERRNVRAQFVTKNGKHLVDRAPSGSKGKHGWKKSKRGQGASGKAGSHQLSSLKTPLAHIRYLFMLKNIAHIAEINRDFKKAIKVIDWLLALIAERANKSHEMKILYKNARNVRFRLESHPSLTSNTCIQFLDPVACSDSAGAYLEQAVGLEKKYQRYIESSHNLAARKKQIQQSMDRAEQISNHQSRDLDQKRREEEQLSKSIGELNHDAIIIQKKLKKMPDALRDEHGQRLRDSERLSLVDFIDLASYGFGLVGALNGLRKAIKASTKSKMDELADFKKDHVKQHPTYAGSDADYEKLFEKDYPRLKELKNDKLKDAAVGMIESAYKASTHRLFSKTPKALKENYYRDQYDAEAEVSFPEVKILKLKRYRNSFREFISNFIKGNYKAAHQWRNLVADFCDTAEARINLVNKLSQLRAARLEVQFQYDLNQQHIKQLKEDLRKLEQDGFELAPYWADHNDLQMEQIYLNALNFAIELVRQEAVEYQAFSLKKEQPPKLPSSITAENLKFGFHNDYRAKIVNAVKKAKRQRITDYKGEPFTYEPTTEQLAQLKNGKPIKFALPLDKRYKVYNVKLVSVDLKMIGLVSSSKETQDIYCSLTHMGLGDYMREDRAMMSYYLPPLDIGCKYSAKRGDTGEIVYGEARNPSHQTLPSNTDNIGYSPFTTWKLLIQANDHQAEDRYNLELDWSNFSHIEIYFKVAETSLPV